MIRASNGLDLFVAFAVLATVVFIYGRKRRRSALPYPPGPKKLPVLGNLLDLPTVFDSETYARWSKEHNSDIIHLSAAGNDFIVLNSFNAAIDLLERRSSIYSSRPPFKMIDESLGWKWLMSGMPYGDPWRERRRAFTKYFQGSNAVLYRAQQTEIIRKMSVRLLDTPDDFFGIIQHSIGGMALSLAYSLPTQKTNEFVTFAEQAVTSIGEASTPGAFLFDIVPLLKYVPDFFPGAGFKHRARIWRRLQEDVHEVPFKETIRNMASGAARPSFTSTCLQNLDESADVNHQKEVIKDTAAIIFVAGADTTTSSVHTFFAAMLCYPETQRKAQEELDRVLGERLPEFSDEPDLPYISAMVKEILRWKPVAPIALPHCNSEDDVYRGYHIPKGSLVIANSWAMLYDECEYPDPSAFKPERFLKEGKLNSEVRDPALMAFGFGRRLCPGNQVATSALWLTFATILATFEISKAVENDGSPIEPSVEYPPSLIRHPLPFKCTLKARSKVAAELIRSAGDSY